jgi:hypothetical protein
VAEENCVAKSFTGWYFSPVLIRMVKSRSMRWAEHTRERREMSTRSRFENLKVRNRMKDLFVDGGILLEGTGKGKRGMNPRCSGLGQVAGFL